MASDQNPADHTTKSVSAAYQRHNMDTFLPCPNQTYFSSGPFDLFEVCAFVTLTKDIQLGSELFKHFSNWKELLRLLCVYYTLYRPIKESWSKMDKIAKDGIVV